MRPLSGPCVMQESGLWCAVAVLNALLEPDQVNNLLDKVGAAFDKVEEVSHH